MVMDVARTSMIHAAAPHFLWSFAVQYAAHQINLQPRVSLPETTPTLRWTGKVGDASAFRVWGSRAFVRDTTADKLSSRAVPSVFLGFPPDAPGWQFYHPTSRRVLSSQDVTFDDPATSHPCRCCVCRLDLPHTLRHREDPSEIDGARAPPLSLRRSSRRQSPRATTGANHGPPSPAVQRPQLHPTRAQPTRAPGARPVNPRHPGTRPGGHGPYELPGREPRDHTPESSAQPADPQRGTTAAPGTLPALRLTDGAPPVTVLALIQPEEQEQQAVERDTAASPVPQPRSQTPCPPQEEPTAGAPGSHEQRQMQRELGEGEWLTVEGTVQAHRAQTEDGTHVQERRAVSCSSSPARFAPVASHQRRHAVNQPSLQTRPATRHARDRDPPSIHPGAHASPPAAAVGEGNHAAYETHPAHLGGRANVNGSCATAQPEDGHGQTRKPREAEGQTSCPGHQGMQQETPQAAPQAQEEAPHQTQVPPQQQPPSQQATVTPEGEARERAPRQEQGEAPRQTQAPERRQAQAPAPPRVVGRPHPPTLIQSRLPWSTRVQVSPRQTLPQQGQPAPTVSARQAQLTPRQTAAANTAQGNRHQPPPASRGGRGGQQRAAGRGRGRENGFQRAARRALTDADVNNAAEDEADEEQDPTFISQPAAESTTEGSGGGDGGEAAPVEECRVNVATPTRAASAQTGTGGEPNPGAPHTTTPPTLQFSPEQLAKDMTCFNEFRTWDLTPLRDSRQPPLSRKIPHDIRTSFANALLTPLLHLARHPDSVPGWRLLLFLPRLILCQAKPGKPDWPAVKLHLRQFFKGEWELLYEAAVAAVNSPLAPRHQPDELGKRARAEGIVRKGSLRRAILALESTPVADPTPEVLDSLKSKHPPTPPGHIDWTPIDEAHVVTITSAAFAKILCHCENGVGAGPLGMTFEHLRDAAIANTAVTTHLHALVNTILQGNLPEEVCSLLTSSRLIALAKPEGGTRPIAVGECVLRLVANSALSTLADAARAHFLPLQYCVAVQGGSKAIIHAARSYMSTHSDATILQADLPNAFNSISCEAIVAGLRGTTLEGILPLVQSSYGAPSELFLDTGFNSPPISSITGVRQGDPLGPLLFAAGIHPSLATGIHPSLAATAAAFPTVLCLAFADDVTFLGGVVECTAAFTHFTSSLRSMGLRHNGGKCVAFIGAPDGAAAFIRAQLQAMTTPLSQIADLEPQAASLLLTRCISRRMSYLARTTSLTLLPEEEWSRWGQKLLHTLLDACGVRHPRGDVEEQRVWGQASLPPSLGGLGLADPSVEGRYSYLASFVQAHGLLASLPGPAGAHLSTALNWTEEVDLDPNQLQTWLGECKASLTQEGRDLLAAEMAAPKG
ncbi:unnamed protein product [Closterium sp. NIES-53]